MAFLPVLAQLAGGLFGGGGGIGGIFGGAASSAASSASIAGSEVATAQSLKDQDAIRQEEMFNEEFQSEYTQKQMAASTLFGIEKGSTALAQSVQSDINSAISTAAQNLSK